MRLYHTNQANEAEGIELEFWLLVTLLESAVALAITRSEDPEVKVREMADAGIAGMVAYRKFHPVDKQDEDMEVTLLSVTDSSIVFRVNGIKDVEMIYLGNVRDGLVGIPTRTALGDGLSVRGANIVCGQKYMHAKKEESHG